MIIEYLCVIIVYIIFHCFITKLYLLYNKAAEIKIITRYFLSYFLITRTILRISFINKPMVFQIQSKSNLMFVQSYDLLRIVRQLPFKLTKAPYFVYI